MIDKFVEFCIITFSFLLTIYSYLIMQKRILKKLSFALILLLSFFGLQAQAQTDIVTWTFEGDVSTVATGTGTNAVGSSVGSETFPAGNGGGDSWSFNGWSTGALNADDYFQFSTSTSGFEAIQFLFDERRSGTGIRDFEVRYSTDGTTFTAIPATVTNVPDNTQYRSHSFDFSAITAIDNQTTVFFRVYGYNAEAATGTWRFDNVKIQGSPAATTLFISEYAEGSSSNKGLEVYNPSNTVIDLATGNFTIEIYSNGNTTVAQTINLTGTIAAQGTYVVTDPSAANATLNAASDQTGNTFFNGDDAVVLKENGTIIDVIGQVGFRPSGEWGTGLVSTKDNTIRRKCSVTTGDINPNDVFDPATEWDGFLQDTFDGFGSHCPTAVINTTGTLTAFTTTALNVASAEQSYQVSGTALTADITITAPTHFQISLTTGAGFGNSVTVPFATANAGNVTIFVRYNPSAGTSHSGDIANASTGAATQNVAVTGTVPPSLMTIAIARTQTAGTIVTIEGVLTAADQFGGPAFIQDATGGIAVFDTQVHGGAFPIGRSLRITATRADFNNQIQLSNVTVVTDLGAGTPVVPQVITLDQLDAHRGELVQIVAVTFPSPDGFLFGNSNYTVTNGANSGDIRIDGDTDLAGRTEPNVPCDVTGVVAYFQTASQLIPRFQADLPCTNVYVSPTSSTVTACIALPKTLEVSTYNVEWFGFAQGGTPSGNTSPAAHKLAVKAVLKDKNSDIYFLQEINNTALMQEIATELTAETPDTWAVLFSERTSYQATTPIAETQKVGFLYKSNIINPQFSYPMHESIHPYYNGGVIDPALAAYPEADKTRFWASGRLPFMMRADVTLNGSSEEVNFIVLHSRSGANPDKYAMRRFDVSLLQDSVSAWLGSDKVIMGGDYNDDVDVSINAGILTSYDAFTTRPADYTILSKTLSDNGFRSTVGYSDMIDHLTVSNELANGYIPNSVSVGYEYYNGTYERTTSDHFIVSARLEIVPIASCTFIATANSSSQITLDWADNSNIETTHVIEFSLDGLTGWTAITGSPFAVNSITGVVTGLTASTQYFFRVRAEESATNFSEWVLANTTTLAAPIGGGGGAITPTVSRPINFMAEAISTSQINLTWSAATGATGYILYRGNIVVATLGAVTSFEDTGLIADTFYSYSLVATNGTRQSDAVQTNARTFPDAPSVLSITNACNGSSGIIKVSSTGAIYRIYADQTSVTPLFETDNATITTTAITQATTFYVSVVSSASGLESERTAIEVTVNSLPIANILEDRIFSCASTGTITAEEVAGASYTWFVNGASIETTTTAIYEVNRSGNYQVRVTFNGCSSTSDITSVILNFAPLAQINQGEVVRSCESSATISAADAGTDATYEWIINNVVAGNTASISVSQSGVYALTVTQNGCSATDEVTVEISTINPNVSITASQDIFCPEEEVTLSVDNPEQNVTYTWVRNGRVLRNSTGTEYMTSIAGEYRVQASQNSCTVLSAPVTITRTQVEPVYLRKENDVLSVESITVITDVVWFLEGEENTSLAGQMSFTPTVAGNYSAQVTFETGCQGSTRTVYYSIPVVPVVTGEDDIIDVETIIYPNPSKTGIFRIQLSNSITSDVTFTITDNIGRVLENKVIKANEISSLQTLDLSQYAAGMYALTIDTKQGTVIKKIIIE